MTKQNTVCKTLFALIAAVISAALLLSGAAAVIYWHGVKANVPVQDLTGIVMMPTGDSRLGDTVTAYVLLKIPWHRQPIEAVAEIGKGAAMLSDPAISRQQWGIGYAVWKILVEMRPYRTGLIPPGKIEVKFNRYNEKNTDLGMDFRIPEFKVLPLEEVRGGELLVASRMPDSSIVQTKTLWIISVILLVLLVTAILYYSFRRRQTGPVVLAPWEMALLELAELRIGFRQGKIEMDTCFVKLTDVVRQYLEKRFQINAPQQTTDEFLRELNNPGGALPGNQRPFLREFMTAADLVKFAKLPPDEHTLSVALDKAEVLVAETRPASELNKKGGVK